MILRIAFLVFYLLGTCVLFSQESFEGLIKYKVNYVDKVSGMTTEQAKMFIGDIQTFTIKGEKYKSEFNGQTNMIQIYPGGDTIFTKVNGYNVIFYNLISEKDDEIISFEITENIEEISDYSCDLLTIKSKEGTMKYYYSDQFPVDKSLYQKHNFEFWNFCVEKTGALPLKSEVENSEEKVTIVASQIIPKEVNEIVFKVPSFPRQIAPK